MCTSLLVSLLLLSVAVSILADQIPGDLMKNATRIFMAKNFPCVSSRCSSTAQCIASGWDEAAVRSKHLTAGCKTVLYSVAIGDGANSFNHIGDYWKKEGLPCSVLFLSSESAFRSENPNLSKVGNWHIVLVTKLNAFSDDRKAAKLPKLFPSSFFARSVHYALYIDAKIKLRDHPLTILQKHLIPYVAEKTFLTLIGHEECTSITHEVALITKAKATKRPTITHHLPKLEYQRDTYSALNITGEGRMVDTAVLMHNLRSTATRPFFCTWEGQLQKFSDRDQIAFQGTVGWLSRDVAKVTEVSGESLQANVRISGGEHHIRILPAKLYHFGFRSSNETKFATLNRLGWNA